MKRDKRQIALDAIDTARSMAKLKKKVGPIIREAIRGKIFHEPEQFLFYNAFGFDEILEEEMIELTEIEKKMLEELLCIME